MLTNLNVFTDNNILYEVACSPTQNCNTDQIAFRAILSRALANWIATSGDEIDSITPILRSSAQAAAAQCSGGDDGNVCGSEWTHGSWDGTEGLGQDLSVLEILMANMPVQRLGTKDSPADPQSSGGGSNTTSGSASATSGSSSPTNTGGAGSNAASTFGLLAALGFTMAYCL